MTACAFVACYPGPGGHFGRGRAPASREQRAAQAASVGIDEPTAQQIRERYRRLPLAFVANAGQTDPRACYTAQGENWEAFLTARQVLLTRAEPRQRADLHRTVDRSSAARSIVQVEPAVQGVALGWRFLSANPDCRPMGQGAGAGTVSYLLGNAPSRWRLRLPATGEVGYTDLWPGVDLRFRGTPESLEGKLIVRAGGSIRSIGLGCGGPEQIVKADDGSLQHRTAVGTLIQPLPVAYQEIDGRRVPARCRYTLCPTKKGGWRIGLEADAFNPSAPLIITLRFPAVGTEGRSHEGERYAVATDDQGRAYLAGSAWSFDFPTKAGPFAATYTGHTRALVAHLDRNGIVAMTYLGGSGSEAATEVAVDRAGNACVVGCTCSADFPTTVGAFDRARRGNWDLFIAKLGPGSAGLQYATYLGGGDRETVTALAVDSEGSAYISGVTDSPDFPTTRGTFDGNGTAFLTKLDASGRRLLYSAPLPDASGGS